MIMKTFLFCLLVGVAAAVPHAAAAAAAKKTNIRHVILEEILQSLNDVKVKLSKQTFVQGVLTSENCSPENICKAGEILLAYSAPELGLKEDEWLLPRKLVAYTRDIHCDVSTLGISIELRQLLHNIEQCAKKEYHKS